VIPVCVSVQGGGGFAVVAGVHVHVGVAIPQDHIIDEAERPDVLAADGADGGVDAFVFDDLPILGVVEVGRLVAAAVAGVGRFVDQAAEGVVVVVAIRRAVLVGQAVPGVVGERPAGLVAGGGEVAVVGARRSEWLREQTRVKFPGGAGPARPLRSGREPAQDARGFY